MKYFQHFTRLTKYQEIMLGINLCQSKLPIELIQHPFGNFDPKLGGL